MNKLLMISILACSMFWVYEVTRPVEHFNVSVVVKHGDCLQDIICDLQQQYGDQRDWREIAHKISESHNIKKWIYPGQKLIVPLEIKR